MQIASQNLAIIKKGKYYDQEIRHRLNGANNFLGKYGAL